MRTALSAAILIVCSAAHGAPIPRSPVTPPWAATVVDASLPPYSVVGDSNQGGTVGTDNTTALAAAISAVEYVGIAQAKGPRLLLPTGYILTGCQTINGQIFMEGASNYATVVNLKSGSNCPVFTILITGTNYPGLGYPAPTDWFTHFRVTSVDGANAGPSGTNTAPLADAFYLPITCTITGLFTVDDVTIYNVPGDGVHGNCTIGGGQVMNSLLQIIGNDALQTNSTSDWKYLNLNIDEAYGDNIGSGGDASLFFFNINSYESRGNGGYFYGNEKIYMTGHNEFNQNLGSGMRFDGLTNTSIIQIDNMNMGVNNDDVYLNLASAGQVLISQGNFPAPSSGPYNFNFFAGSTTVVDCIDCTFGAGEPPYASGITNQPSQLATLDFGPFGNLTNTIFANGVPFAGGSAAIIGACGTSPSVTGNNFSGTIISGTGTFSSCAITWGLTRANVPSCAVTARSGAQPAYAPTTGGLTLTTAATSAKFDYQCTGG